MDETGGTKKVSRETAGVIVQSVRAAGAVCKNKISNQNAHLWNSPK